MAQLLKVNCLSEEQVEIVMRNMCKIRNLDEPKIIDKNKPKYSQELCAKHNIPFITKFAEKYICYLATKGGKDDSSTNEGFIIVFSDKVDQYNVMACAALYYENFDGKINPKAYPPKLNILPAFVVTEAMKTHYKTNIIPDCNYRIFSLTELYPMIGSKKHLFKLTYNYHKFSTNNSNERNKTFDGKELVKIFDNDPIVKLLNAVPGDIITCNALSYDDSIFSQTFIREVAKSTPIINRIPLSGICLNT